MTEGNGTDLMSFFDDAQSTTEVTSQTETTTTETTTEQTPAVEATTTETTTTTTETTPTEITFDWEKATGGKFKSKDEIENIAKEYETLKAERESYKPKQLNEVAERLNDFLESKAGDLDTFFKVVSKDFSTLSELDAIKENMRLNNSEGLTEEEIELSVNAKFKPVKMPKPLGEFPSDEETEAYEEALQEAQQRQKLLDIERKREANKAKESLTALQAKYKTVSRKEVDTEAQAAMQAQMEADLKVFDNSLKSLTAFEDEVVIDAKDGKAFKLKFEVSQDQKDQLLDLFTGKRNLSDKWIASNGMVDEESWKKDMVYLHNRQKRESAIAQQAYNLGKEEMIKERVNPSFTTTPAVVNSTGSGKTSMTGLFD